MCSVFRQYSSVCPSNSQYSACCALYFANIPLYALLILNIPPAVLYIPPLFLYISTLFRYNVSVNFDYIPHYSVCNSLFSAFSIYSAIIFVILIVCIFISLISFSTCNYFLCISFFLFRVLALFFIFRVFSFQEV